MLTQVNRIVWWFLVEEMVFVQLKDHMEAKKTNDMIGLFQIHCILLMANLDKSTVRNEVSRLKDDFEQLCADGKISSESKVLMNSMFMIIELILSIFLERSTKKDNQNSSKPSSQTEKDESALGHQGSNGKGKNENSGRSKNARTKEKVTVSTVNSCTVCGEDLTDSPCTHIERRTKIDIVFEKVVEHVDAQIKHCPVCDSTVKGTFPTDMHGPL
jgi:hypothetical protein